MKKWTQTNRGVHFLWFPVPASTSVPFVVALLHVSWATFGVAFLVAIFQVYLRMKGRNVLWVIRRFKARIGGDQVQARSVWYRRRMLRQEGFGQIQLADLEKL